MKSNHLKLIEPIDLSVPTDSEITFKALMEMMEKPFCALGKKRRFKPIKYKNKEIEILITSPQPWGIATIYDMDILMWISSRIMNKVNKGEETSPVIEFTPYDCLKSIGRSTGGYDYKRFIEAVKRLFHTHIVTTIRKEDQFRESGIIYTREKTQGFHWILEFELIKGKTKSGKEFIKGIKIILSNWLYLGLRKEKSVLQLANDYFKLKSGLDRALYLIARKHVGRQALYSLSVKSLYKKTGSDSPYRNFIIQIKRAVERNILPEYAMVLSVHKGEDLVDFHYRPKLHKKNKFWEPEKYKGK